MGLREYIFQKMILTPGNVGYLVENVAPYLVQIQGQVMKDSIMKTLQDEEIAQAVASYSDALLDRELKRFWGSVGGKQKGLNFQMQEANPLAQVMTKDGGLNLPGIINFLAQRGIQNRSPMSQIPQNTRENRTNINRGAVPNM